MEKRLCFVSQHFNAFLQQLYKKDVCVIKREQKIEGLKRATEVEWRAAEERRLPARPTLPTLIPAVSGAKSTNINRQEQSKGDVKQGKEGEIRGEGKGKEKRINDKPSLVNECFENSSVYQQQSCSLRVPGVYSSLQDQEYPSSLCIFVCVCMCV